MKTNIKRSISFAMAMVLTVSALAVWAPQKALAAVRTWDGDGGDDNWNTAANWSDDTAPVNGDSVVFDLSEMAGTTTATNNISNLSLAGLSFTGVGSSVTITGNALTVTGNITDDSGAFNRIGVDVTLGANVSVTVSNDGFLYFGANDNSTDLNIGSHTFTAAGDGFGLYSNMTGSGGLVVNASISIYGNNSAFSGSITVNDGGWLTGPTTAFGTAGNGTTVGAGGSVSVCSSTGQGDVTVAEPLTLTGAGWNGNGQGPYPKLQVAIACGVGGGSPERPFPYTIFSGAITLGSDVVWSGYGRDAKITGTLSGAGYKITPKQGSDFIIVNEASSNNTATPSGSSSAEGITTTYTGDRSDENPWVSTNNTIVVADGAKVGNVNIIGGTLKGVGTVGNIDMISGKVAPGLSPGCLSSGSLLYSGGTVEIEINNATVCTGYDQQNVTGTVDLGSGVTTLSVLRLESYKPNKGTTFMIISNDGTDAVTGTFRDLPEGGTLNVDGVVYSITYRGNDGNDVVLTVIDGPNTGFKRLVMANPAVVLGATVAAAGAVYYLARRYAFAKKRS